MRIFLFMLLAFLFSHLVLPADLFAQDEQGSVRIPLPDYQELLRRTPVASSEDPGPAFSNVQLDVRVERQSGGFPVQVHARATVRTFGDGWTWVPLAAIGPVEEVKVGGEEAQLARRHGSVGWIAQGAGVHQVEWSYRAFASRYERANAITLPALGVGARFSATFVDQEISPLLIPASNLSISRVNRDTRITATLSAALNLQLSWPDEGSGRYTLSRAHYRGQLVEQSSEEKVRFFAEFHVDLEGHQQVMVPLFPASVALESVSIDRLAASIAVEADHFVIPIQGQGRHRIVGSFVVPVQHEEGLPHVDFRLVSTPISRFELDLPGNRDVQVMVEGDAPFAGVDTEVRRGRTMAQFNLPMTNHVEIAWADSVPEGSEEIETRAHADIVHVVKPDEGILDIRAFTNIHISRGTLRQAEMLLPPDVQVNAVDSSTGAIGDWRIRQDQNEKRLVVFLDREVRDHLDIEIHYERAWPVGTRTEKAFHLPLLRVLSVNRQRGMVALLVERELTLEPLQVEHMNRVGDNRIPSAIRETFSSTVAHTYRYLDEVPVFEVVGALREPEPARFDVQVDTLVSIGDVSTTVATRMELDIKSGSLTEFDAQIPVGLNVLEVSAPSLRRYSLDETTHQLHVELTQPMEGRFAIELLCERVMGHEEELSIPLIAALGAEVERGRVGVESLAPFQIDVASAQQLSAIDPSELPESLILRTDNPILLAYRYAQATQPPQFSVRITRHSEIQTRQASVEHAHYATLYTRDGIAVTRARFTVRNHRQQFLRIELPQDSEVWSATVDGRTQAPALETGSAEAQPTVLLNIVSATDAFPVELVYSTSVSEVGSWGRLNAELPSLDLISNTLEWEILFPDGIEYAAPTSTLSLVERGYASGFEEDWNAVSNERFLQVPSGGTRYLFRKMYAGRRDRGVLSLPYVNGWSATLATVGSMLGTLLIWLGVLLVAFFRIARFLPHTWRQRILLGHYREYQEASISEHPFRYFWTISVLMIVSGLLMLSAFHGYLSLSFLPVLIVTGIVVLSLCGAVLKHHLAMSRENESTTLEMGSEVDRASVINES